VFGLVQWLFNDLDDFFCRRFLLGERRLFSWRDLLLGIVHFRELKIVGYRDVNSRVGGFLILNALILIHKVIGGQTIVLVGGLRRVPPTSNTTGALAHGFGWAINMLLALLNEHPLSKPPILGPCIYIHRPISHISLELRTRITEY
jgi:hypothetical protein